VVGERLELRLRPGQSYELLEVRTEEYRAACKAREVRLTRDPNRSNRVTVDVFRHDTLAKAVVAWVDRNKPTLSIWDAVWFGINEFGLPVLLCLIERAFLLGGNRGAGKSNALNVFVAHVAKCADADLLLIDANRVQLGIWRHRALAFAAADPDEAIGVLLLVQAEMERRLDRFAALPGSPTALTKDLAQVMGIRPWVLVVDELAYHCSVAGTGAQQKAFYAILRDIVARGRAAGVIPIVATQRPTHDLIPTSLRDLFDIRIAFRTMTRTSSDVILGDDFAKRGFTATDIDLKARGVCLLFADGTDPVRLKTAYITPKIRTELAVTTRPNRGALPQPADRTDPNWRPPDDHTPAAAAAQLKANRRRARDVHRHPSRRGRRCPGARHGRGRHVDAAPRADRRAAGPHRGDLSPSPAQPWRWPMSKQNSVKASLTRNCRERGVVENDTYVAFVRRIVAAYARRVGTGDVEALPHMLALSRDLDAAIGQAVTGLRKAGYSWAEIASRLGITRQAAHQRWGDAT
jgi:S-DNA-T family DNA segregation ATPase FtsK/SpoIIIE